MEFEASIAGKKVIPLDLEGRDSSCENLFATFQTTVGKFPNRIAISHGEKKYSYLQFSGMVSHIASVLEEQGVSPGDTVAIYMPRCILMVSSLWAIMKLGATYVPIDPSYPAERVQFILSDTSTKLVLVDQALSAVINLEKVVVIERGRLEDDLVSKSEPPETADSVLAMEQLKASSGIAYILYTSGSTGKPKGVQVTHANLQSYIYWARITYETDESDIVDFSTSLAFDVSVGSVLVPLLCGARICVCSEATKALPNAYLDYLIANRVSLIKPTPSYFSQLTSIVRAEDRYEKMYLKTVVIGGEALVPKDLLRWLTKYPSQAIHNEYGPTEATVGTVSYRIDHGDPCLNASSVPIGKPIYNTDLYILDASQNLCEKGREGELYISGSSVSAGYLNRDSLNQKLFIEDLFEPGQRLYRTGDLVRQSEGDNLEYLGRIDRQVKVRGFRLELGEIESAVLALEAVDSVTVEPIKEGNDTKLVAYVVLRDATALGIFELRQQLRKRLPDYMIPSYFVFLEKLPLTINGKLDKAALPLPTDAEIPGEINPAETQTEEVVIEIWEGVLRRKFGVTDDFFVLGGDSLNAAQIIHQIQTKMSVTLSLDAFYRHPSVRQLSQYIDKMMVAALEEDSYLLEELQRIENMQDSEIEGILKK